MTLLPPPSEDDDEFALKPNVSKNAPFFLHLFFFLSFYFYYYLFIYVFYINEIAQGPFLIFHFNRPRL